MNSLSISKPANTYARLSRPLVLVIENNDDDYRVIERSFQQSPIATKLHRCHTGRQALEYLERSIRKTTEYIQIPTLILLDLNLPEIEGSQVLKTIKEDPVLHYIPTVILTTSARPEDIKQCYYLGAGGYLRKATDLQQFKESMVVLSDFWLNRVVLPELATILSA